jgi:hypothetical protein
MPNVFFLQIVFNINLMNFASFWGKTLDQKIGKINHVCVDCEKILHQGTNFTIQTQSPKSK